MTPEENLYNSNYTPTILIPFLFIAICIIMRRRTRNIIEVHLQEPQAETEINRSLLTWQYK